MTLPKKLLFTSILVIAIAATAVQADTVTIDQSNTPLTSFFNSIQSFPPIGQSFTPSLSSLNFVDLSTKDLGNTSAGATLRVNIRIGSITGTIAGTSADVVLPDGFGTVGGGGPLGGAVTSFSFATPVSLVPGNVYVIEAVVVTGDNWAIFGSGNSYPGGTFIQSGAAIPSADLYFVEGLAEPVPEPTTIVLFGTALAGLIGVKRTRSRRHK